MMDEVRTRGTSSRGRGSGFAFIVSQSTLAHKNCRCLVRVWEIQIKVDSTRVSENIPHPVKMYSRFFQYLLSLSYRR